MEPAVTHKIVHAHCHKAYQNNSD